MSFLDEDQSVVRYCKPSTIDQGAPTASAFSLRSWPDRLEEYLSVDWLEFYESEANNLSSRKAAITATLTARRLPPKPTGRLAAIKVGDIKKANNALNAKILKRGSSYSGVFGYLPDQEEIAELLSQNVYDHCSPY